MTTERTQADPQAQDGAAAGSGKGQDQGAKPSRVQEFVASLTDPAEVAEFRKLTRSLLEPDFQAQDKTHQRRVSAMEKRAKDAEAAVQDLADPDIISRYQQEKGSLEKAKERAVKNGLPAYAARHVRSFEDLWDAEDDFRKNRPAGAAAPEGESADTDDEQAAFVERLKRAGAVLQPQAKAGAGGFAQATLRGGGTPGVIEKPTFDPRGSHVKQLKQYVDNQQRRA